MVLVHELREEGLHNPCHVAIAAEAGAACEPHCPPSHGPAPALDTLSLPLTSADGAEGGSAAFSDIFF